MPLFQQFKRMSIHHAKSDQCKYQKNCNNKLCQYRHQKDSSTWRCNELKEGKPCQFQTKFEVRLKNHSLGKHGKGDVFNCDHCEFKVKDRVFVEKAYRRRTPNKI